jgi:hypothetical protein
LAPKGAILHSHQAEHRATPAPSASTGAPERPHTRSFEHFFYETLPVVG